MTIRIRIRVGEDIVLDAQPHQLLNLLAMASGRQGTLRPGPAILDVVQEGTTRTEDDRAKRSVLTRTVDSYNFVVPEPAPED